MLCSRLCFSFAVQVPRDRLEENRGAEGVRDLEKKMIQFEQDAQREREEAAAKLSEATRRVKELEKEKEESQVVLDVDPNAVSSQSDSGIDLGGIFSGNEPLDFGPVLSYNDMLSEALELCFDSEIFANV